MAPMMQKTKKPMMAYTRMIEVPDSAMILPEPMNNPVPIAPLIEISCMCRFSSRLLSTRPASGALLFALHV